MRFKIVISFILAAFMLYGSAAMGEFKDTLGTKYEEPVEFLSSLGVISGYVDGSFKPDVEVTRAEFITMIIKIMDLEEIAGKPEKAVFTDVPADYWAAPQISLAAEMELVNGVGDGNFRPDENVIYQDALRVVVNMLGYVVTDEQDVTAEAFRHGLTDGLALEYESALTRGDTAILLYNCVTADVQLYKILTQDMKVEAGETKPFMSVTMGIEKATGRVQATEDVSLISNAPFLDENEVMIDGEVYTVRNNFSDDLIGCNVRYYYTENDDGEKTVIYARPYKSEKVEILSEDIEDVNILDNMQIEISYYAGENKSRQRTLTVSKTADIAYNGAVKEKITEDDLMPDEGKLLVTDNGNGYDTVIIYDYEIIAADRINSDNEIVYAKYNKAPLSISADKFDKFEIRKNDKTISIDDIKEWDILSVAKSAGNEKCIIIVSDAAVSGQVSSIDRNSEKEVIITLGEQEYRVSRELIPETVKITPGNNIFVYLNHAGKISAFKTEQYSDIKYGYIINAGIKEDEDNRAWFKIFTMDNNIELFDAAEKVNVNAGRVSFEKRSDLDVLGGINQLVIYKLNAKGELSSIDTAYTDTPCVGETVDSLHITYTTKTELNYRSVQKSIQGKAIVDENTVLFFVPEDVSDEQGYLAGKYSNLKNGDNYAFTAYSIDTSSAVSSVLVLNADKVIADNPPMVVSKVIRSVTDDDDLGYRVIGYTSGSQSEFLVNEDVKNASEIKAGDIIRTQTNRNGKVNSIQQIFSYKSMGLSGVSDRGFANVMRVMFGNVYDIKENKIIYFTADSPEKATMENIELVDVSSCSVIEVNREENTVELADVKDITSYLTDTDGYSKVFIYMRSAEPRMVVVYN